MQVTTILIEDSPIIRSTLVATLEELTNVKVVIMASTAREAKEAVATWQDRWHLIIIDLFLTEGSGLDVLEAVQSRSPEQYAYVLSNYATDEMTRRCKALGADEVFDKSRDLDAFLEKCLELGSRCPP